jgi:hypothetical protein
MPAIDPFSRASRASDGFDSGGLCAASEQSVGLASLPGFFSLVLALAGQNRLLLNARSPLLIGVRRIGGLCPRRLIRESVDDLGGSPSIQDRSPFPQDQAVSNESTPVTPLSLALSAWHLFTDHSHFERDGFMVFE